MRKSVSSSASAHLKGGEEADMWKFVFSCVNLLPPW